MPNKLYKLKDGSEVIVKLRDDGDEIIKEIDSYTFKNGEKAAIFLINYNKYVVDHYERYISPKNKNFDVKGLDKDYTYGTLYFNCVRMATTIHGNNKRYNVTGVNAGKELFKIIYDVFKINGTDTNKIDKIVDGTWFIKNDNNREFLRQLLITIHFGFYAEDNSLKEKTSKYLFGRKYNLVKIYMVLIEKKEPLVVHKMWNRDGVSAEEKDKVIRECMRKITTEFDKEKKNMDNAWEETTDIIHEYKRDETIHEAIHETIHETIHEDKRDEAKSKNKNEGLLDKIMRKKRIKSGKADAADYWE